MSKNDRLSFIALAASRANRVLAKLDGYSVNAARRILRRTCPRRHIA